MQWAGKKSFCFIHSEVLNKAHDDILIIELTISNINS